MKHVSSWNFLMVFLSGILTLSAIACEEDMGGDDVDLGGEANLALTEVPDEVLCVKVKVTGITRTVQRKVDLTAGEDTSALDLGRLPLGQSTFEGWAYNAACDALSGAQITHFADPIDVELRAGVVADVYLAFRENNSVEAEADFLKSVRDVVVGEYATGIIFEDGTIELLTSTSLGNCNTDVLTDVVELTLGRSHGCALKDDGSLWCFGYNGQGQVGAGENSSVLTPVQILSSRTVTGVTASGAHTCATTTGSTYCWGWNAMGQLGLGTTDDANVPARLQRTYVRVYAGPNHTCGQTSYGVECWGWGSAGQLGNNEIETSTTPVAAQGVGAVVDMSLGYHHTVALLADGTIQTWGNNYYGQLGDGTTATARTPQAISGIAGVTNVAAGTMYTCLRFEDSTVSCFGGNERGQLGDGSNVDSVVPIQILEGTTSIEAGTYHSCAMMEDLTVKCWGWNSYFQLGNGTRETAWEPTEVTVL